MFTRVLRSPDAAAGSGPAVDCASTAEPSQEARARAGNNSPDTTMRSSFQAMIDFRGEVTDDHARDMLDDISKFLLQLAHITSGVLSTIDVAAVRRIVAENAAMPGYMPEAEQAPDRDHRKNPRGRKHPLLTLVQFALQGVRMLLQITAAVHPNVHGKESFEQKQMREKLKEEERELSKILSG
jgi:hypothetical protein